MTRAGLLQAAAVLALALVAFGLVLETGSKGFLAFDQSIVFDGGYRVSLGQVPFRDFFAPTGPVPFWIQGAFFRLGSVTYGTYLLHAAVVNAAAALLAFVWVRWLFPEAKLSALLAGLLTAIWFYPLFGTPWLEQTAFLFHLVAMVALAGALLGRGSAVAWGAGAGIAAVLAFLSKQNAGLLTLGAVAGVALAMGRPRPFRSRVLAGVGLGLAGASASFTLWLFLRSHPGRFWTFFLEIPAGEGARRLAGGFLSDLLLEEMSFRDPVRAASVLALMLAVAVWVRGSPRHRLAAVSLTSLVLFQALFVHLTNNEPENGFAFAGLIAAMAVALARGVSVSSGSGVARAALGGVALVMSLSLAQYGWDLASSRYVHDVFFRSRFDDTVVSEALKPVRWALPTPAARRARETIEVEDVDALASFLTRQEEAFFVFPDYTILYGITGKTPPQPVLWFHPGLTYSREKAPWLDALIVRELQEHEVRRLVLEKASWQGTERRLSDFPALERFVNGAFEPEREFGNFRVLRRRGE